MAGSCLGGCRGLQQEVEAGRLSESADGDEEDEYVEFVFPVEPSLANLPSVHIGILRFPALTPLMEIEFAPGDPFGSVSKRNYLCFIDAHMLP